MRLQEPAGHCTHEALDTAPAVGLCVPEGHRSHAAGEVEPLLLLKVPTGQGMGSVMPPVTAEESRDPTTSVW